MQPDVRNNQAMSHARSELAFLGPEFLTWLYFHLENIGGEIPIDELFGREKASHEIIRIGIGKRLSLKAMHGGDARMAVSGSMLDDSGEVLQAVRSGSYIDSVVLDILVAERIYNLTLNAADGSISQVKMRFTFDEKSDGHEFVAEEEESTSAGGKESMDDETTIMIRMSSLDEVEDIVDALFQRFLSRRLGQAFMSQEVNPIRTKVAENLARKVPPLPKEITNSNPLKDYETISQLA